MNGETKCARFLGSPGPAEPENLAHLLLPSLHHSNGKATCAGMGWREPRDRPRPQSKTHFFRKEFIIQNLALIFQFLPAPSSFLLLATPNERRDQMCQVLWLARPRWARQPGAFAPSLFAPQQRQGQMCRKPEIGPDPNQKRTFYEKNLSLKIWP